MPSELRCFGYDHSIDVLRLKTGLGKEVNDSLEQCETGDPTIGVIVIRKVSPNVSECRRAEKSVAEGVREHIGV